MVEVVGGLRERGGVVGDADGGGKGGICVSILSGGGRGGGGLGAWMGGGEGDEEEGCFVGRIFDRYSDRLVGGYEVFLEGGRVCDCHMGSF